MYALWLLLPLTGAVFAQDVWRPRLEQFLRGSAGFTARMPIPEDAKAEPPSSYVGDDFILRVDGTITRFGGRPVFSNSVAAMNLQRMLAERDNPVIEINGETASSGSRFSALGEWWNAPSSVTFAVAAEQNTTQSFVAGAAPMSPDTIITSGTGTWTNGAAGTHNWGDSANWQAGNIPDGSGVTADFSQLDFDTAATVNLEVSRTVGTMYIGDSADFNGNGQYTVTGASGAQLIFQDPSGTSLLQQVASSGGDTIAVPIVAKNFLEIQNYSPHDFTISGGISAVGSQLVQFSGYQTTRVTGAITDGGGTGNQLRIGVVGSSTVIFTGTNTYTGTTAINGATLLVNGDNSAATGSVSVVNSGSMLGGTGTIGGDVTIGSGGRITGGTATTVGTLTLSSNLTINGFGEGLSPAYLVNLDGATSDKLAIGGTLSLPGFTELIFNGSADGTTTYVLATFTSLVNNDHFDFVQNMPSGYSLIYNPTDVELVPVPEPATWIGAALAAGVLLVVRRRKSASA